MAGDLKQYYGMDLHDVVSGKYSPTYVLSLLETLPPDSRLVTALRGGFDYAGWDRKAYILADLVDAIQGLTHIYVAAHVKRTPKAPEEYPRPGVEIKKTKKEPNPLLIALKGDALEEQKELGPGSIIPLPENLKKREEVV